MRAWEAVAGPASQAFLRCREARTLETKAPSPLAYAFSGLFAAVLRARSAVDFAAGLLEPDWHADFR